MDTRGSRYQGKPLLRVLECYVLWAIDRLPAKDADILREMTPKLRSVYQAQGEWQQVIATAMQLPADMPATMKKLWLRNCEIALENRATLTPQQFAEVFVDQNFAS